MPSLRLPHAKCPLHLGGVKQWLKEDLLNSSMPWLGLEPSTSASAVCCFLKPLGPCTHYHLYLLKHLKKKLTGQAVDERCDPTFFGILEHRGFPDDGVHSSDMFSRKHLKNDKMAKLIYHHYYNYYRCNDLSSTQVPC